MRISVSYYYYRGGSAAGPALSSSLSHHHVISYPRMYYLGVLSLCYLKRLRATGKNAANAKMRILSDACRISVSTILDAVNAVINTDPGIFSIPEGNNDIRNTLCRIAWMPGNLFIGPASGIRADDPSQNNDKLPVGMPNTQKTMLNQIIVGLNQYSHSYIPHVSGAGGQRNAVAFDNAANFNKLMEIFFNNISGTLNCYDSKISDWLIAVNNNRRNSHNNYNYYNILFYTGGRAQSLISTYRNQRQLVAGKFAVKETSHRNVIADKNFKVLSKDADYVYGIVNNLDDAYREHQNDRIQDYLR